MILSAVGESCVVKGGNGIDHIGLYIVALGKLQTATDYHLGVVATMCAIETIVARYNLLLDILL
jgi:hypothetical protein